jgi:hypothetical protein
LTHKRLFENENPVVIDGSRGADILIVVLIMPVFLIFALPILHVAPHLLMPGHPISSALGFGTTAWGLIASAWRLLDRRPALVANEDGFILHPSLTPRQVSWANVASISVVTPKGRETAFVRILLERPIWSFGAPLGTQDLRLHLPVLGIDHGHAVDLVRQLLRLKSSAEADVRQVS